MQTYSHMLLAAALRVPLETRLAGKALPAPNARALLFGSLLPDLPLIFLAVCLGLLDLRRGAGLGPPDPAVGGTPGDTSLLWTLFDDWFFHNPWVIAAQNLFHSPLLIALGVAAAWALWRRGVRGAGWGFWLACAAMLHTLLDIPLHHDDGPLLLFPLNWELRFLSPVSYWDPEHFGRQVFLLEHLLDLALIGFLVTTRRRRRRARANSSVDGSVS